MGEENHTMKTMPFIKDKIDHVLDQILISLSNFENLSTLETPKKKRIQEE